MLNKYMKYAIIMISSVILGFLIGLWQYHKQYPISPSLRGYYLTSIVQRSNNTRYNHWVQITGNHVKVFNTVVQMSNQGNADISLNDKKIEQQHYSYLIKKVQMNEHKLIIYPIHKPKIILSMTTKQYEINNNYIYGMNIKLNNNLARDIIMSNRSNSEIQNI